MLGRIKSIYVDSLASVRVKGGESKWFRIDREVRQGSIMFSFLFNVYIDAVMKEDDDLEEELRAMVGQLVEVCKRRGLKLNAVKSKVMMAMN